VTALGDANPVFELVAALVAGGMASTSHVAKAGTRLVANASPEPVSNIGLSLAEDGIVLGGLGLIVWNPIVALAVAVAFAVVVIALLPRLLRGSCQALAGLEKLNALPEDDKESTPGDRLPGPFELQLRRAHASKAEIAWSVPCLSGAAHASRRTWRGWLAALREEPNSIFFICKKFQRGGGPGDGRERGPGRTPLRIPRRQNHHHAPRRFPTSHISLRVRADEGIPGACGGD